MFALQAGGSVMKHQGQKGAVKARNRARLANFELENEKYLDQVMLRNNAWKDQVSQQEIQLDNIFKSTYDQWNKDDAQLDAILLEHSFNTQDAMLAMHKNSYAGTMTGVTAGRLAAQSTKDAGRAISKTLAQVILNKKKIDLNADVIREQSNQKQWSAWEKIRRSPIHGQTPRPPQLESKPPIGPMLLEIAVAGAGATMSGMKMAKLNKMEKLQGEMLKNMETSQFSTQLFGEQLQSTFPTDVGPLGITQSSGLYAPDAFKDAFKYGVTTDVPDTFASSFMS